jgi:putative polyhydroxyalkanoate system protein
MADIELHRVHNLGLEAARAAADRMAEQLGRRFDLKGAWDGNVLKFERPGVTGSLAVTDKDLRLSVALGFLLKAMKGSIEQAVVHELDQLFVDTHGGKSPRAASNAAVKPKKAAPPPKKNP